MPDSAPLGCILGSVEVTGCVETSGSIWFGGPFGLVLAAPRAYTQPIPCKGQLGFFDVPAEVKAAVRMEVTQ